MRLYRRPDSPFWWCQWRGRRWSTDRTNKTGPDGALAVTEAEVARLTAQETARAAKQTRMLLADALQRCAAASRDRGALALARKLTGGPPFENRWHYPAGTFLDELSTWWLNALVKARIEEGESRAAIARELVLLKRTCAHARRHWNVKGPRNVAFPVAPAATGALELEPEEFRRVLAELALDRFPGQEGKRQEQLDLFTLWGCTGWRYGQVAGLAWAQVEQPGCERITAGRAKASGSAAKALPELASAVLRRRLAERQPGDPWVFPRRGDRTKARKLAVEGILKAMRRAGVSVEVELKGRGRVCVRGGVPDGEDLPQVIHP